jgi:hypothetical protein
MNRARGETGSLVAALGGLLLLVSLFLAWYQVANFTVTAWTAFEVWDLVLAALALAVIVAAATEMGWWRGPTHSVGPMLLAVAALVIVASQLIDPPPSVLHSSTGDGGWLALVAGVLMVAGALVAESRVTLSFGPGARGPVRRAPRGPADVPAGRGPVLRPTDRAAARVGDDPDYVPPPGPPPPRL